MSANETTPTTESTKEIPVKKTRHNISQLEKTLEVDKFMDSQKEMEK